MSSNLPETIICERCRKVEIYRRYGPLCAVCSNAEYSEKVRRGEIVEIKIDRTRVRESTVLKIRALIAADMERECTWDDNN